MIDLLARTTSSQAVSLLVQRAPPEVYRSRMSPPEGISGLYRAARLRIVDLVDGHPERLHLPVPATPGWRVHDVVAHLVGCAEDVTGGRAPVDGPTPEWTATHVGRGRGRVGGELLDRWEERSRVLERIIDRGRIWPIVVDVGAHEHDIRGALGDTGARNSRLVTRGAAVLLDELRTPLPLRVCTETGEFHSGPPPDGGLITTLRTTSFEAFRWRLGRRSRAQLRAMHWDADPMPFLDHLCEFGPAEVDVVE